MHSRRRMRIESAWASLGCALIVLAGCPRAGSTETPAQEVVPDETPAAAPGGPRMTWTAELVKQPLMIERHVQAFPNAGGTLRPRKVGLTFKPCTEAGEQSTTVFRYDQAGRLIDEATDEFVPAIIEGGPHGGVVEPATDHDGVPDEGTHYRYVEDRLASVVYWWSRGGRIEDPGKSYTFSYDASGRLARVGLDERQLGVTVFEIDYDAGDRLLRIREFNAKAPSDEQARMLFEYDEQDRLVRRSWSNASGAKQAHVFTYRSDGNLERFDILDVDAHGNESKQRHLLRYDTAGRYTGDGGARHVGQRVHYDDLGRPAGWVTRDEGEEFRYTYGDCSESSPVPSVLQG